MSVCNIANNKPFVKRLSIIMAMLEHSNYDPKPCFKIFELEEKLKKAEAKIINLKIKISEQQTLLLKAAKEIKTHYEEVA